MDFVLPKKRKKQKEYIYHLTNPFSKHTYKELCIGMFLKFWKKKGKKAH